MKKLLLFLAAGSFVLTASAQQLLNTPQQSSNVATAQYLNNLSSARVAIPAGLHPLSPDQMQRLNKNSVTANKHYPHSGKKTTGTTTYTDWYDLWDQNYGPSAQGYYLTTYPDSNIIDDYSGVPPYDYVQFHGVGMSFDPTDSAYSTNAFVSSVSYAMPLTGQSYTIDSYYCPIQYLRHNPSTTVIDSVIIELVVTQVTTGTIDSGASDLELSSSTPSIYFPITADMTPRFGGIRYNAGITAPYNVSPYINDCYSRGVLTTKYRYALPLNNANKWDTSANGCINLNQVAHLPNLHLSPAINITSSNTHVVSYVSFKSGVAYPFGTYASAANLIHCFAGSPTGPSTWFPQSTSNLTLSPTYPGSYQSAVYAINLIRYNDLGFADPTGTHDVVFPGYNFVNPFFSVSFDEWHVTWTCTTPSVGAILGGAATICTSATVTFSDATAGGTWSTAFGKAVPLSSPGDIYGSLTGVDTVIYTVTNGCGSVRATKTVTVITTPSVPAITGPSSVCVGATIKLTDATSGGTWNASFGHATVTSGGVLTGLIAGSDNIFYSLTNTCGTGNASKPITVNPLPNAGSVTATTTSVCVGNTITVVDAASGGTWSTVSGNASVVAGVVTGVSAGVDTVKYAVTNTCGTSVADTAVTVNPLPVPVVTVSGLTLNTGITYTSYQWLLAGGGDIFGATSYTFNAPGPGIYEVTVTDANGCTGTSAATTVITGVQNINALYNVRIYPNPAQSLVTIASSVKADFNVQLTAMDGRVVLDKKNVDQIDIANLPNGNYILTVFEAASNLKITTERLVKSAQ